MSKGSLEYSNIALHGHSVGNLKFSEASVEWKSKSKTVLVNIPMEEIKSASWTVFGIKAYMRLCKKDGKQLSFDGFSKGDYEGLSAYLSQNGLSLDKERVSSEGSHYGTASLSRNSVSMSSVKSGLPLFDISLENVSMCVVPQNNKNEVEVQFHEPEHGDPEEDGLVQFTLHFPEGEEDSELSPAEQFRQDILAAGVIRSVIGDVIVEFNKEQGNFITPRGKYTIQMMSTQLHMQGAQYSHTIKYSDITALHLLPKPDGRTALVISLKQEIRQGNQKYQHLVIEVHNLESTVEVKLTEEEITEKFSRNGEESKLKPLLTKPLGALIATVLREFTQVPVHMPKQFSTTRGSNAIRCSLKASEGLLYPMAKSFIFIHKPTIIIKFADIEIIEFQRYDAAAKTGTRNFDLRVVLTGDGGEYLFASIDKAEKNTLFDFAEAKQIQIMEIPGAAKARAEVEDEVDDEGDSDESEDGDYEGGEDDEEDDDNSGSDASDSEAEQPQKGNRKRSRGDAEDEDGSPPPSLKKKSSKSSSSSAAKKKEKKAPKDKNAPKGAKTAFIIFSNAKRDEVKAENPDLSFGELGKELGDRWKRLSAEDKRSYEQEAKKDKDRFERESKAYSAARK